MHDSDFRPFFWLPKSVGERLAVPLNYFPAGFGLVERLAGEREQMVVMIV
jgi:hypothetical protein